MKLTLIILSLIALVLMIFNIGNSVSLQTYINLWGSVLLVSLFLDQWVD